MSEIPQTDLYNSVRNLGLPLDAIVVIGSGAVEAVLGPEVRRRNDLDLTVTPETYNYLRNVRGLEEVTDANGGDRHLTSDGFDVNTEWNGKTAEELKRGGFTRNGVHVAGLPDVYGYKEGRGTPKDLNDMRLIRERLYGNRPLPKDMLGDDLQFVQGIIPEHLKGHPAVHVAANGLYIVRTVFGKEDETVRNYSGSVETTGVPATYHAWEHSAFGARDGQESMDNGDRAWRQAGNAGKRYSDNERLSALAFTNHDVVLGHGRRSANPDAHDEQQAAELVDRHLQAVGVTNEKLLKGSHETVIVTTYDETRKAQDIDPTRGHLTEQENGAAMDMSAMRRPDGPLSTARLAVEDFFRVGAGYDQPLRRLIDELNAQLPAGAAPVRVNTTEDGLRLIEQYPDFPVVKQTPDGPVQMTLLEALGTHIGGSGWFYGNYTFPERWQSGDAALHTESAGVISGWGQAVKEGTLAPTRLLDTAEAYRLEKVQQATAQDTLSGGAAQSVGVIRDETDPKSGDPVLDAIIEVHRTME